MNWLVPAQTLLDLLSSEATPALAWADSTDSRAHRVSVVSIAQARAAIIGVDDAGQRARLDADLASLLAQLEADSGVPPLPFTAEHAAVWEALMLEPSLGDLSQVDRQVYATAMHEGLTVVEESHAATAALQALGVAIQVI